MPAKSDEMRSNRRMVSFLIFFWTVIYLVCFVGVFGGVGFGGCVYLLRSFRLVCTGMVLLNLSHVLVVWEVPLFQAATECFVKNLLAGRWKKN